MQGVAPILFGHPPSPGDDFTTSDYAPYPPPRADTSLVDSWGCYPVMDRFNPARPLLSSLSAASSLGMIWRCRFCFQSKALTFLLSQDRRRHVVGSFLSSSRVTGTVSRAPAPGPLKSKQEPLRTSRCGVAELFFLFLPHRWITPSFHEDSFCLCNDSTRYLCNTFTCFQGLSDRYGLTL